MGWARAEDMESIIGIVLIMLLVLPFPLGVLIGYRCSTTPLGTCVTPSAVRGKLAKLSLVLSLATTPNR